MRSVSQVVQKLTLTHDLDLDSITFITEPELYIVMIYLNNKNEANRSKGLKVIIQTTQTDRRTRFKPLLSCFCGSKK